MEDKIEVGEYVRTKDGIIDKVIIEYDEKCNNPNCDEKHISCKYNYYNEKDIVKHSKQLVDLIDVGDFVNGFPILEPIYNGNTMYGIDEGYENFKKSFGEIKTILTGESYMANCYKVGGEEDD